ncbi:hypothetical protein FHL15_004922 [Xylaria flabelliformis]|uniref:Luciferase domain-containing protein n=1 Tax=Xylaria flabelliformis TaxID=2512241 RepID=A0A553I1T3_9PEZI|nr:hypothetical protein FHL15_004922 [Xylaria flabelliformis]
MDTLLNKLQSLTRPEHQHQILYTTTATTAALLALLAYSRHCYLEWHALGEGGVPRDLRGWLINVLAHVVARRDHRGVPAPYEKVNNSNNNDTKQTKSQKGDSTTTIVLSARDEEKYGPWSKISFFPESFSLPFYKGPRPTVPTTVLPQRQTTQTASPETLSRQSAYLHAVASANPSLFAVRPSALESPKFDALWLVRGEGEGEEEEEEEVVVDPGSVKWFPPQARGETVHVHPEGSTHMCLSLVDAAEVVRRGWGERHKMSGVAGVLPWGYVLIYAPREGGADDDGKGDWEVWKELVIAAARVVARSAGFEGEVVVPE